MDRLDQIAFDYREEFFLSAFFDELLTPTTFEVTFGSEPDDGVSALFAGLLPAILPDGLTDPYDPESGIFYAKVIEDLRSASFVNGLIGGNYPPPGGVVSGRDGTLNGLKGSCACKASGIHNGA